MCVRVHACALVCVPLCVCVCVCVCVCEFNQMGLAIGHSG